MYRLERFAGQVRLWLCGSPHDVGTLADAVSLATELIWVCGVIDREHSLPMHDPADWEGRMSGWVYRGATSWFGTACLWSCSRSGGTVFLGRIVFRSHRTGDSRAVCSSGQKKRPVPARAHPRALDTGFLWDWRSGRAGCWDAGKLGPGVGERGWGLNLQSR
jgi:hypothetical protein